jgi:hypothetical protein
MQIESLLSTTPIEENVIAPVKQQESAMDIESPQKIKNPDEAMEEEEDILNEEESKSKESSVVSADKDAEYKEESKPKKKKKSKEKERSKAETLDFPKDHACLKRLYYLVEQAEKIKNRDEKKTQSSLKSFITTTTTDASGATVTLGEGVSEQTLEGAPAPKKRRQKKLKDEEEVNEEDLKDKKPRKRKTDKGDKDKPKRRKSENSQPKKVNPLPTNSEGKVVFPIHLGVLSILQLGTVVYNKPGFHSTSYIWPIGFKSTRQYASMKDPERKTTYFNEIIDNGDAPIFRVSAEDDLENPIDAPSPTAAWKTIIERVNVVKAERTGKRMQTTVSGPEYFGFSHPSIAKLIQELPNSDKCLAYKAKEFVLNQQSAPSKDSSPPLPPSIGPSSVSNTIVPTFTAVNMNPTMSMSSTVSPLPPPLPASLQIPPPKFGPNLIVPAKSQIKISDIIDINSDSKETPSFLPQMFVNKIPLPMPGFNPFNDDDNDVMSDLPVSDLMDPPKLPPRMMFNVGSMGYPQFVSQPPPTLTDPNKMPSSSSSTNGNQADRKHINTLDNFFNK